MVKERGAPRGESWWVVEGGAMVKERGGDSCC